MFAPIKTVLDFNAGLMLGIENMSQDWFNWSRLKQYHDQHLHSLKLSTNLADGQQTDVLNDQNTQKSGGARRQPTVLQSLAYFSECVLSVPE